MYLMLSAVLLLAACSEPAQEEVAGLFLKMEEVTMSPEGGSESVEYELKGADATMLRTWCNEDWLEVDMEDGVLKVTAVSNDAKENRRAVVLVSVPGWGMTKELSVLQYGQDMPDLLFEVIKVTENRVIYDIIPRDKEMTYTYLIDTKANVDQYTSDEDFYNANRDLFEYLAESYKMTFEQVVAMFLTSGNVLNSNTTQMTTDTDYVLYGYGMTSKGEPTTAVFKIEFKTLELQMISPKFDVQSEIEGRNVTLKITPEDNNQYYFFEVVEKSEFDADYAKESYQAYLNEMIARWETNTWMNIEQAVRKLSNTGYVEKEFRLTPMTEYVVFLGTISGNCGLINSDLIVCEFVTEAVAPSKNEIGIELTTVATNMVSGKFTVTNNDDQYAYINMLASDVEGLSEDEIKAKIMSDEFSKNIRSGYMKERTFSVFNLTPDTDYMVIAFGYERQFKVMTTKLFTKSYKTLAK